MQTLIVKINDTDIQLTGETNVISSCVKYIVYAIKNLDNNLNPIQEVKPTYDPKYLNPIPKSSTEKKSKYSQEDNIAIYEYLAKQGNYEIKQFEITRGGQKDQQKYLVCLVFDIDRQRYVFANPRTDDNFIKTYTIEETIKNIKDGISGFHMIHKAATGLFEKMSLNIMMKSRQTGMSNLTTHNTNEMLAQLVDRIDPFSSDPIFKDYDAENNKSKDTKKQVKKLVKKYSSK